MSIADANDASPGFSRFSRSACVAALLIAISVLARVPGVDRPLLGNFATKNVVYAMIARNWAEGRSSLWTPSLDCLAGGQRAWHLVEFPLPAYVAAVCWKLAGGSLEIWGRALSIAASALSTLLLYLLVRRWHGEAAAAAAAALFALSPVSVIYGQSFMLEPSVVALSLGAVWTLERWRQQTRRLPWLATSAALMAMLLLTKIYMLVLLLPLAAMVWRREVEHESNGGANQSQQRTGFGCIADQRLIRTGGLLAFGLAMLPAVAWYAYAGGLADAAAPTAQRVYYSFRDSASAHALPHPLLSESGFYFGVLRNLATVTLTPVGVVLLGCGFIQRGWQKHLPWLIACGALLLLLPRKFHEMNYYYLAILPPLCAIAGLGWEWLCHRARHRYVLVAAACLGVLFSARYSIRPAFVTPEEDAMVVATAERVRAATAVDEPIVTLHGSTIDLLYYCDRPGFALSVDDPALDATMTDCARQGAGLLAVAQADFTELPDAAQQALAAQRLIEQGPGYRLYRLRSNEATARERSSLAVGR